MEERKAAEHWTRGSRAHYGGVRRGGSASRLPERSLRTFLVLAVTVAVLVTVLAPPAERTTGQGAPGAKPFQSLAVVEPPVLDGVADDDVWAEAVDLVVKLKGGSAAGDLHLKSVYSDPDIYFLAQWEDSTMSLTRGDGAWEYVPIPADTVRSSRTSATPVIDGQGSDKVWDAALPLSVHLEFGTNPGYLTLRSLYNTTHVFFLAQWNDPTFSIPGRSWVSDGGAVWERVDGLEDAVNMMWDVRATGFDTVGCQVKCHIGKDVSYLDNPTDLADMWHMMAGRSLAATSATQVATPTLSGYEATAGEFRLVGFADDEQVVYDPEKGDTGVGGRLGDAGTPSFTANANASGDAPLYMEKAPADWLDAMVLQRSEVVGGEVIVADPSDPAYDQGKVDAAWALYEGLGASVPEEVIAAPTGSRGDVTQAGVWRDGVWSVEMSRPLVTGNDDDVQFSDLGATYDFGVSTMNNTAGRGHNYHTRPMHLDFQQSFRHGVKGVEDQMAFLWEITPITGFLSAGCYVKCHPEYGTGGAFLENPDELGDLWQMKAARSLGALGTVQVGPVQVGDDRQATDGRFEFRGFLDDMVLTYDEEPHLGDAGRKGDVGESSSLANSNPDGTRPLYMEAAPTDWLDAMVLQQSEIDSGQALEVATASASSIASAAAVYASLKAYVPERIVRPPTDSRGDMSAAAVWEDGTWTLEFKRPLVTGHPDDVQFEDPAHAYAFSVTTMDDATGKSHSVPGTDVFALGLYVPPKSYTVTVGPLTATDGNALEGVSIVLEKNATTRLNGTTGPNGTFEVVVPPEWADSVVTVVASRDGYQNLTFMAAIADNGEMIPLDGSYPEMRRLGEGGEDEAFLPGATVAIASAAVALTGAVAATSRRRRGRAT